MQGKTERQREHFNAIAGRYAAGRSNPNHERVKGLIWKSALTSLAPLRGRKIQMLEPMCGYAEGLEIVSRHGDLDCDYSGFDYSDVIVDQLSRTFFGGKIWQADATSFVPQVGAYDLVLLIGGLHHVPDSAERVVANMSVGLKRGGMFVSFEPTFGNPLTRLVRQRIYSSNDIFDQETERDFAVQEYLDFFRKAGLERVRVMYPGLLAYVLYYNTYAFPALNRGGFRLVNLSYAIDSLFINNWIGKISSFATLSIWRKPE